MSLPLKVTIFCIRDFLANPKFSQEVLNSQSRSRRARVNSPRCIAKAAQTRDNRWASVYAKLYEAKATKKK